MTRGADPLPVREPDTVGWAERDGVRLAWKTYGEGPQTVLLMPTWQIIDSRFWKAQLGYLARHFRVVTYDGRGTGASDAPRGPAAYSNTECAEDAVAVLDATGTDRAVLVGLSAGATWSIQVAADHPDRVAGLVAISPAVGFRMPSDERGRHAFDERLDSTEGWAKCNKHYWLEGDFTDFRRFFFQRMCSEPHSTKQLEDLLTWSEDCEPQLLVDATVGRSGGGGVTPEPAEQVCERVRCPVLVLHGTDDRIGSDGYGRRLAELTGGRLVLVEGGGHALLTRDPVLVNREVHDFVTQLHPPLPKPPPARWVRAASRPRRVLYLSSPIGLGHAARDVAIARELRAHHPELQIDWLAQHPVTSVLQAAGEHVHPASEWLASESGHVEFESGEHDLHAFQAIRRMDAVLVNNFMVFHDVVEQDSYDLVVGDEAWDVDYFLHENPELKRFAFAWMTDFVGWLPMPEGGAAEARLTADYNAEMIEQRARFTRVRDRSVFVGSAEDVVPDRFGEGLPRIRDWVQENFDFAGYVTGFDPAGLPPREQLRRELGLPDGPLCVVSVGGTGVGRHLLERVLDAVPLARRRVPGLRFLIVCGPRIDPASLPRRRGARVRGYLPQLHRHLAAADVGVVQGGLTTCMELTASRTPFVYVPLEHHFEQNFHVRHRLQRYEAGHHLSYAEATDPAALAEAIVSELAGVADGGRADYRPVETDGAARAAQLLAELL